MNLASKFLLAGLGAYAILDHVPRRDQDIWWRNPLSLVSIPVEALDKVGEDLLPHMAKTPRYCIMTAGAIGLIELLSRSRK